MTEIERALLLGLAIAAMLLGTLYAIWPRDSKKDAEWAEKRRRKGMLRRIRRDRRR